jgi:hypothetical protein
MVKRAIYILLLSIVIGVISNVLINQIYAATILGK